jgi:hypothetical protein
MTDATEGSLAAVWFRSPYLARAFQPGQRLIAHGQIQRFRGAGPLQMLVKDFEVLEGNGDPLHAGRLVPVYGLTAGVTQLRSPGTSGRLPGARRRCARDRAPGRDVLLHSGSRGVGNRIRTYFIERAKEQALKLDRAVKTDVNLAWLDEGTPLFQDYVEAVGWAQRYARRNRDLMMEQVVASVREVLGRAFRADLVAVNSHHNYVEERAGLWITRKDAVSAKLGELGIIPGSMGGKSFIVRGKGNAESFESCSHGAGRSMSRGAAKRVFTLADHAKATEGVECRKDKGVIDETPGAYKSIDAVMAAQTDLVDVVATLKQLVCVKG